MKALANLPKLRLDRGELPLVMLHSSSRRKIDVVAFLLDKGYKRVLFRRRRKRERALRYIFGAEIAQKTIQRGQRQCDSASTAAENY